MSASKVFFTDMRTKMDESLLVKGEVGLGVQVAHFLSDSRIKPRMSIP